MITAGFILRGYAIDWLPDPDEPMEGICACVGCRYRGDRHLSIEDEPSRQRCSIWFCGLHMSMLNVASWETMKVQQ